MIPIARSTLDQVEDGVGQPVSQSPKLLVDAFSRELIDLADQSHTLHSACELQHDLHPKILSNQNPASSIETCSPLKQARMADFNVG